MTTYKPILLTNIGKSLAADGSKLVSRLAKEGFEVISAPEAGKAIEMAEETPPDIFLLNPKKPRMNGYLFCGRLKENPRLASIPVVFIAAKATQKEIVEGFEVGGVDYITRPFGQAEIIARLSSHIGRHPAPQEPSSVLEGLNATLDSLPALLVEVDQDGRIYEYRAPSLPLSFSTLEETRPATVNDMLPGNPALVLMDAIAQASETEKRVVATCPVQTDKGIGWMELSVSPQSRQPSGNRFIVLVHDISKRKLIEKEKTNLEDTIRQEEKMESIGLLAGGVSHDMNNILSVVMGLASAVRVDLDPSSSSQEDIEQIALACRKGIELTSKLMSLASEMSVNKERLSLNNMVEGAGELFNRAISNRVDIEMDLDPECSDFIGDPIMINHVLINLALNSADAMTEGGTLTFSTRNYDPDLEDLLDSPSVLTGRYVILQVSDTGEGMSQEVMKRAFEPFYSTKSTGVGAGLGLSMVYGMVKSLGGRISLDSDVGRGTTATVFLPASEPDLEDPAESDEGLKTIPPITQKCLVVDDNEMILFTHRKLLQQLGYVVVTAQNGAEAVEIYERQGDDISFVLLDLIMPVTDGAEVFKALKEIDPDVRVLLCTGYSRQETTAGLLEQGALGVLKKPFELEELSDKLSKIVD